MPGVRIQHPTDRSCTFLLVDSTRPYRPAWDCPVCHTTHIFKTYHIKLDEVGASIVSVHVLDLLKRIPLNPFQVSNEVEKPPPQRIEVPITKVKFSIKET